MNRDPRTTVFRVTYLWKHPAILVTLISFLLPLLYYAPIVFSGTHLGIQDWDQNFAWNEFVRRSILTYHQFPYWDPYRCGGTAHFANPQITVISIQTLFVLLFGTVTGIKLSLLVHGVIGFLGAYLLARYYSLSRHAAIIAALLFSFNGIVASFLSTGMIPFINYTYSPYVVYCFLRGKERTGWLVVGAGVFAFSYLYSSHVLLLLLVYLAFHAVSETIIYKDVHHVVRFLIFTALAVLLAAPKLILSLQLMTIFPRYVSDPSGYTLPGFWYFLTSGTQGLLSTDTFTDYTFGVDENSLYIGLLPLLLLIIAGIGIRRYLRTYLPQFLALCFVALLMMGDMIVPSLFQALKHLPLYASFGVAQRFRLVFILPLVILAGFGFDYATSGRLKAYRTLLCILLVSVVFIDLLKVSHFNFLSRTLIIQDTLPHQPDRPFTQRAAIDPPSVSYVANTIPADAEHTKAFLPYSYEFPEVRNNTGVIQCYDAITGKTFATGTDQEGYRGEWYTLHNTRSVSLVSWTPHAVQIALGPASSDRPDALILNQNYYPGWHVRTGQNVSPAHNIH